MAKIETTFIRPKELFTPDTGETKVVYDGYQNNPHELITEDGFAGALDTAMPTALAKAQVIETTWQALKDLRDNSQLIAGSLYRITDYQCTTTQENTQSAGHQFDIVLLALSDNKLAEEGWAMMHDNIYDVTFADGVTKKCYAYFYTEDGDNYVTIVDCETMLGTNSDYEEGSTKINEQNKTIAYPNDSSALTGENLTYNYFQNSNLSAWKVWYCLDNDKNRFAWADEENGKGVVYRLVDEFNNDIKYDFKNIQFKRKITDGQYDATNGTETWCYTLNLWYEDMCQDASIVGNTLPNDEGFVTGVYDNVFGYCTAYDLYIEGVNTFAYALGNNVVLSFDDGGYYGIYSNTVGNNFFSNTIGNDFNSNTVGNAFFSNTIGNDFSSNTVGNSFISKTISDNTHYKNYGNNGVELATKS